MATFAQPPVDRSDERDERLAELIRKYTEEQGGDPDPAPLPDRFENYPFTFARDYTDDIESNVTRSGEYHGFARGKDFANADIDGGVTLKFDLASSAIFGTFDFGSTGLLHVSGNVDADALTMHLDDTQRSSFSGFELDRASATFDDVNFFGPTGEEIGGYWGINIEQGVAWGEFATGRKP